MSGCIGLKMKDVLDAWNHMNCEVIKDYGSYAYGHYLHTFDEGKRILVKCRNCGGYILIQSSEFHGMEDDDYYTDYFPADSPEQAEELNRMYDGFEIERKFRGRYLMRTNLYLHWSKRRIYES